MSSVAEFVTAMVSAAKTSVGKDWPTIRAFARPELEQLARSMLALGRLYALGEITQGQARALFKIHRNTTQTVFLAIEGMGIIATENAINAALKAVKDSINRTVGFALL